MSNYDELKLYNGKIYTGMLIGSSHDWVYPEGRWYETKLAPDKWEFSFEAIKKRNRSASENTGAALGTSYHWYIIADQIATKLDHDSYKTIMHGLKFKLGHKRPYWKKFSYEYDGQLSYNKRIIQTLQDILNNMYDKNNK